jgi:uncharacterized protein (DUF1697 family)
MPRYVVFLRSINVGGHTLKMTDLKKTFENMSFFNVETFIASGNVIFETNSRSPADVEKMIETNLKEALGYDVATFTRSLEEISEIARYRPFPKIGDGSRIYIAFLHDRPAKAVITKLMSLQSEFDNFRFHGRELFWLCRARFSSESPFSGPLLEKTLGVKTTVRNSNTVVKISAKYSPAR